MKGSDMKKFKAEAKIRYPEGSNIQCLMYPMDKRVVRWDKTIFLFQYNDDVFIDIAKEEGTPYIETQLQIYDGLNNKWASIVGPSLEEQWKELKIKLNI